MGHSHSIYVFDVSTEEKDYWQTQLYNKLSRYIADGYAVIYVAEQNGTATVQRLSKMGFDVEGYVESGALTIINNEVFYSPSVTSSVLTQQWDKVFSDIRRRKGMFKGFVAIGMPADSFFNSEFHQQRLVEYESVVAENYDGGVEAMCCYTIEAIDKMPLKNIITLLKSHQNTAHRDGLLKQWSNARAISIIKRGLDEALGAQVSEMIFAMLTRDFMNVDAIISYPDRFENKLRILFESHATEIILGKIKAEFMKEILY